jgi:hypothetical protein
LGNVVDLNASLILLLNQCGRYPPTNFVCRR